MVRSRLHHPAGSPFKLQQLSRPDPDGGLGVINHIYMFLPAQGVVANFLQTFVEYPPRKLWPERERDEVRLIYRNKGFSGKLLDQIVDHLTADHERWSNVMMREELGFGDAFEAPWRSSLTVGLSYLMGAFVPVIPYFFVSPARGIIYSAIATLCMLFVVGAAKTVITTRSLWRSGLESVLTGAAAAAATFGAGYYLWR